MVFSASVLLDAQGLFSLTEFPPQGVNPPGLSP
uniref:Uncharacterized protein n=1 Tax=Anguilla anguilla TaxID=7936 RepID=A0A0E9SA57_ANGAN